MTDIQAKSIPLSLKGGRFGFCKNWERENIVFLGAGLGAAVQEEMGSAGWLGGTNHLPTRELVSAEISCTSFHKFKCNKIRLCKYSRSFVRSAGTIRFLPGLIIGGKNLKDESERLSRMNILVATPGRLLQHMDQTFGFECDNLQLLGAFAVIYM